MKEIDMSQLLYQMKIAAYKANPEGNGNNQLAPVSNDFKGLLKQAINQVSEFQHEANDMATKFEQGDKNINLSQVMIAIQKANVSLQAVTQVRNHLVNAYKDIINMPV
jgi:flagellar hook-basal body complex protein FliE